MTEAWTHPTGDDADDGDLAAADRDDLVGHDEPTDPDDLVGHDEPTDPDDLVGHDEPADGAELVDEHTHAAADEPGIPDEPDTFAEEIRAASEVPETGYPRVDEVLSPLAGIEGVPIADHVAVYDEVHRGLQDALANLDQA